jgi:hypothetical protein
MAKLLLLDVLAQHRSVCFIPDTRSLKTELKHAMLDYLRIVVWAHHEFRNSKAYRTASPAIQQKRLFF